MPLQGGILLNSGDMLRHLSNNTFISTPHRVINTSGKERYSIPFFFDSNMHANLVPIQGDQKTNLEPIVFSKHLMERIKSNYRIGAKELSDLEK